MFGVYSAVEQFGVPPLSDDTNPRTSFAESPIITGVAFWLHPEFKRDKMQDDFSGEMGPNFNPRDVIIEPL